MRLFVAVVAMVVPLVLVGGTEYAAVVAADDCLSCSPLDLDSLEMLCCADSGGSTRDAYASQPCAGTI